MRLFVEPLIGFGDLPSPSFHSILAMRSVLVVLLFAGN